MRQCIDRKQVRSIVWQYYFLASAFAAAHSFFFSTYSVFLVSKGLNLFEINLVNCFFMVGVFVMEIPTGAYADVLGRKNSFVVACFVLAGSMFAYYTANSFWECVLAELIGAVGSAFCSGSLEAWIVDSLKHVGVRGGMHTLFRREQYVGSVGVIAGSLFGGYVALRDLALPWLLGGISLTLLGCVAACIMREDYFEKKSTRINLTAFRTVVRESIHYGIKRKSVLYVIAFSTLVAMCVQSLNMQWQLRFTQDFAFDTSKLGWVFFGIAIFDMAGAYSSRSFMKIVGGEKRALILSQIITVIGIFVAAVVSGVSMVIIAFLFHEVGRGMISPIKSAYMNKRIPSEQRATILSFDSMIVKVGAFVGLIVGGGVAQRYSIATAWAMSAIVLASIIPIFLKLKNGDA